MKKLLWFLVSFLLVLNITSACSNQVIDYVDTVRWNGTSFLNHDLKTVPDDKIGKKLGEVKFKVEGSGKDPSYQLKDGDATLLEKGTQIYEVKESDDIAVYKNGKWILYEKRKPTH